MSRQQQHYAPSKSRVGGWLPCNRAAIERYIQEIISEHPEIQAQADDIDDLDPEGTKDIRYDGPALLPPLQELNKLIETDPEVNMFFHQMFDQIPPGYDEDAMGRPQIKNYRMFLMTLNVLLTHAPKFKEVELVAIPIHAILTWPMGTVGGFAAFLNDKVNRVFKTVLNNWGQFLKSEDSAYVLNEDEDGWFGPAAMKAMPNFKENFICYPDQPHWGFKSWDDFFTRHFREEARPIAEPDNDDIICNPCDSAPYDLQTEVKARSRFWIKQQPYSMLFLLANDSYAPQFFNGTVYQAFLSPTSYHRYHSPVNGTIVKTYVQEGSYYSTSQAMGFSKVGLVDSQGYLCEVATRGLYFIQADNPDIGLMCFIAIGMCEVSTVDIVVYEGQRVTKGQEIGMFHFGGSTMVLVFRPGLNLEFDLHGFVPSPDNKIDIPVRSRIATVIR